MLAWARSQVIPYGTASRVGLTILISSRFILVLGKVQLANECHMAARPPGRSRSAPPHFFRTDSPPFSSGFHAAPQRREKVGKLLPYHSIPPITPDVPPPLGLSLAKKAVFLGQIANLVAVCWNPADEHSIAGHSYPSRRFLGTQGQVHGDGLAWGAEDGTNDPGRLRVKLTRIQRRPRVSAISDHVSRHWHGPSVQVKTDLSLYVASPAFVLPQAFLTLRVGVSTYDASCCDCTLDDRLGVLQRCCPAVGREDVPGDDSRLRFHRSGSQGGV